MKGRTIALLVIVAAALLILSQCLFIVDESQQALKLRFGGKVVGDAISEPGLYFKLPFGIDRIRYLDRRWLAWDGDRNQIPTRDKKYISVDTFARWRIADPRKYLEAATDEVKAQSLLSDVIDGMTRDVIASYDLIELVRSTNRGFDVDPDLREIAGVNLPKIAAGRGALEQAILERAAKSTPEFGVELVDVRFKRIDYIESVRRKVYDRMISERKRIAERSRSEGQGAAAEIRGEMERELRRIRSEAYKTSQELRGKADAEATKIYAQAYNRDPEFYAFTKSLETLERTMGEDTRLLLTTEAEFLRPLKKAR